MKFINLEGLRNTRDIGGYIGENGKSVKYNKFIRSAELSKTTQDSQNILFDEYNIKKIIDFRTDVELRKKPIPNLENVDIYHVPILKDENLGIPRNLKQILSMYKTVIKNDVSANEFMCNLYLNLAFDEYSASQYNNFFNLILENNGAVLFNCTEGKDRTGVGAMLLLMALGVDKDTIINDYMESKQFSDVKKEIYKKRCKRFFLSKKATNFICGIMTTQEIFLRIIFDKIERDYKTFENYLESVIKLTSEQLIKLKDMFLEEV